MSKNKNRQEPGANRAGGQQSQSPAPKAPNQSSEGAKSTRDAQGAQSSK